MKARTKVVVVVMVDIHFMMSGYGDAVKDADAMIPAIVADLPNVKTVNLLILIPHFDRFFDAHLRDLVLRILDENDLPTVRVISAFKHYDHLYTLLYSHQKKLVLHSKAELSLFVNADVEVHPSDIERVLSSMIEYRFGGIRTERVVADKVFNEWCVVCGATEDIKDILPDGSAPYPFCGGVTYISSSIENAGFVIQQI